jgi:protease-4
MRHFLKLVTSSCLGTILAFFAFFFIVLVFTLPNSPNTTISQQSILHLTLDLSLPELTNNVPSRPFSLEQTTAIGLNDLKRLLSEAKTDESISGFLIQTENTALLPTKALEINRAIKSFKESGKFCYAYGDYFTQSGYLIASAADSVFLNPNGFIDLRGMGVEIPYYQGFAEKSNISFDVYHAGKYKSAIEPYYRKEMSKENRYQTTEFLQDFITHMSTEIADNRSLSTEAVIQAMHQFDTDNSESCKSLGLIDRILYEDELEDRLKELTNTNKLNLVSIEDYYANSPNGKSTGKDRIAVIYAEGAIDQFGKSKGSITVERYEKAIDKISKNDKVKAVVLRVNSPGGSAFASDVLWDKIEKLKDQGKTVVASFGDYAASGGYYIACGADRIVSEPTTLTGSIGVFSMIPNFNGFFKEHLGVNWDTLSTGNHNFIYSTFTPKSDADNLKLQRNTEHTYQKFLSRVAAGRSMEIGQVDEIAQGRVWSGEDALEVGLVDTLGALEEAIAIAADLAEIEDFKTLQYPVIEQSVYEELWTVLMNETSINTQLNGASEHRLIQNIYERLEPIIQATETPQARLPLVISQ